jgi:hypothetical protein
LICSTRYFMKKHFESVHENKKPIEMWQTQTNSEEEALQMWYLRLYIEALEKVTFKNMLHRSWGK